MLEITSAQLDAWLTAFLWPFVRILAFIATAPIFGETAIPRTAKVGLAFALTVVVAPVLPPMPDIPPASWAGIMIIIQQFIIGVALGLVMRLVFAAIQAAGDYIALQMGLSFASFYSPEAQGTTTVLSRFLNMIAILMFMALNGHTIMIRLLIETFTRLPIGQVALEPAGFDAIARWGSFIFSAGFLMSLPVLTALLMINISMGILNRASPQFSIFSVGFPITLTTGVILLTFMTPELGAIFQRMFESALNQMVSVTELLSSS
ncbi:flagellar biosynthetic protein FliR [Kushneria marisflavi]|uniref:Flagellar biosynthetic protein FliR n=1 Tax=Kushneria marisflavi TaxID=157779 RepID=A0A240UTH3_9GAMM|nr:flagellar biosynthetic protein FliR [Kushneria marisflavi]ART64436.1 flagellar biosynthetic protein FliR [Kushneria marisflavi]RKD86589.1 flagellar biosynthetic protein FliR [Kushneria marisflavi]